MLLIQAVVTFHRCSVVTISTRSWLLLHAYDKSSCDPSLVSSSHTTPPGEKWSCERSWISWAYYPKMV